MKSWTNLSLPLFRVISEKFNPFLFGHSWRRSILFFLTAAAISTSASITGAFAQEKKMKEHTASVSGRVTIDGKPARGILVKLRRAYSWSSSDPTPSAKTDDEGKFTIPDVHPGDYAVIPAAPALVVRDQIDRSTGQVVVHLGDGEKKEGVELRLMKGSAITGKVATAEGWPLIGLRIEVWRMDGDHPTAVSLGDRPDLFKTDDRGVYRVYGLRPGRYLIRARGEEIGGLTATFHPAAIEASQAAPVHVALGDEVTDVNVVMGKPAPSYSASGRVIDEQTRRPLRGGRLTLEGESNRRWAVEIDQEGQFRINTLPAGKYLLVIGLGDNAEYYSDPLPFQISEADVAGLEIVARRGARVGGQLVFEDGLHGELFQRPNALWLSLMTRPDKPNQVSSGMVARIESDGRFSFSGYGPGWYRFQLSANMPPAIRVTLRRVERNGVTIPNDIELGPAEELAGFQVVLAYGVGVIRGRATAEGGTLPADARLEAYLREVDQEGRVTETISAPVSTEGKFLIDGIIPGTYRLWAASSMRGLQGGPPGVTWVASPQTIVVTNETPLDVTLMLQPRLKK